MNPKYRVTSKEQMFDLFVKGVFGNRLRVWRSQEDFMFAVMSRNIAEETGVKPSFDMLPEYVLDTCFSGLVGLRCVGVPGLPYYHNLEPMEALKLSQQLETIYNCPVIIYEASNDPHIVLNGEIVEKDGILSLRYSMQKTHMRRSFELEELYLQDYEAYRFLQELMYPASWDELQYLLKAFPEHVYELTIYDIPVGILKGRNTIWWEVRAY